MLNKWQQSNYTTWLHVKTLTNKQSKKIRPPFLTLTELQRARKGPDPTTTDLKMRPCTSNPAISFSVSFSSLLGENEGLQVGKEHRPWCSNGGPRCVFTLLVWAVRIGQCFLTETWDPRQLSPLIDGSGCTAENRSTCFKEKGAYRLPNICMFPHGEREIFLC